MFGVIRYPRSYLCNLYVEVKKFSGPQIGILIIHIFQLFGLVNTLLENSRKTSEKDLSIQRYAVIPLSPNSGLIGWVPNCDTLHHLIREYRDARKVC